MITEAILGTFFGGLGDKLSKKLDEMKNEIKPKDVQLVEVKINPDSFSYTEIDKVTSIGTTWKTKNEANMVFDNTLKKETTVKEISLIPDTNFKTKGKIMITIDDVPIFQSKSFTAFENAGQTTIPVNKTITAISKVKFFIMSSDGTLIGITGQVTFGDY